MNSVASSPFLTSTAPASIAAPSVGRVTMQRVHRITQNGQTYEDNIRRAAQKGIQDLKIDLGSGSGSGGSGRVALARSEYLRKVNLENGPSPQPRNVTRSSPGPAGVGVRVGSGVTTGNLTTFMIET